MKIGGSEGSRRVLGLLLMTLGLVEVVKLAHPREWITFLDKDKYQSTVQHHTETIMQYAQYKSYKYRPDETFFRGEIPQLPDVSGYVDTLAECQQNLTEAVNGWILLRIAREQEIPKSKE